jgi:DNA-binding transcriptional LysR family regulator
LQQDLEVTTICHCGLNVVASKKSHLARRQKLTLADLIDEPWCGPLSDTNGERSFINAFRAHGLPIPQTIVTAGSERLRTRLIADGRFVGMIGQSVLQFNPTSPWLHVLPVKILAPPSPIGVVTLKNRSISPAAQRFIDVAREVTKPLRKGDLSRP